MGRHLNIRKPGFLDFSTAILSALQHSFNSPFLFALLFSWDESRMLIELTGELPGEFLLLLKCYRSLYFHGVLWPVSYSVQLKLISCPSSSQCLQLEKLLSPYLAAWLCSVPRLHSPFGSPVSAGFQQTWLILYATSAAGSKAPLSGLFQRFDLPLMGPCPF